jgi:PAS domain S-box-containing protein
MRTMSQQLIQDRIKELRENTDFVNTLLESLIGYAIIAADFDGNVIAFNEGAHQIYGYSPEEIIGKQGMEVFFPEEFIEAGKLQEIIDDLIEKGRFSYEGEKMRKNGERFPAQVIFTLTKDKGGKVVGFVEIVADLTERKQAEHMEAEAQASKARVQQLERELHSLERLSMPKTAATTQMLGLMPLHQSVPNSFSEMLQHYGDLMELALEQQVYRVDHDISGNLRSIADELGYLKAGPRDVVELHSSALKRKTNAASHAKAQAYVEEGRMMVLELMGHLASYYRTYSLGVKAVKTNDRPIEEENDE